MLVSVYDPINAIRNYQSTITLVENSVRFPDYFVQSTLLRIGGKVIAYQADDALIGIGLLFPRQNQLLSSPAFTLRYHAVSPQQQPPIAELIAATQAELNGATIVFYDPSQEHHFSATAHSFGSVEIGRPSQAEAHLIPGLQQQVWGSPTDECYPADLHSAEFSPGTSLVARIDGQLTGFLIGFYKFGGYPLPADWHDRYNDDFRLESQIMGVLPQYRGLRIANLLKRQQALDAIGQDIDIINWTADPLQYANAALNFGLLRAVSFDFMPNLYAFRNELNRVPASRLSLTWLVKSSRVQQALALDAQSSVLDLSQQPQIVRINQGWRHIHEPGKAPIVAIEIPANWTALQRTDPAEALRWRTATDDIFTRWVGKEEHQYTITGVGTDDDQRFLIGEQRCKKLWHELAS